MPFFVLGLAAYSVLTLDRDVAVLRKQVMAATDTTWKTQVQLSVGRWLIGLVRTGFSFVKSKDMADAKLALSSVRQASVGVYKRESAGSDSWSRERLLVDADRAMNRRGWTRLVGVVDQKDTVLIYVPAKYDAEEPIDLCLSVVNERELVVVSATIAPEGLAELIQKHAGDELKRELKLVQL